MTRQTHTAAHQQISDRLRTALLDSGLTQPALAAAIGCSQQAISKWLAGTALPNSEWLPAIAAATERPVPWLLGCNIPQPNPDTHALRIPLHSLQALQQTPLPTDGPQITMPRRLCLPTNTALATNAEDDSMAPTIQARDTVGITPITWEDLVPMRSIIVAALDGRVRIRRYAGPLDLWGRRAENLETDSATVPGDVAPRSQITLLGRVTWIERILP